MTAPLYCSVDPDVHRPFEGETTHALGYLGTYSADRQAALERLMIEPARRQSDQRLVVAGAQYPDSRWPANVDHVSHVPPARHAEFYGSQRFTLNVTRAPMVAFGHSPSVRLFEAACSGAPIISDIWPGVESFFDIGREILLSGGTRDTCDASRKSPRWSGEGSVSARGGGCRRSIPPPAAPNSWRNC